MHFSRKNNDKRDTVHSPLGLRSERIPRFGSSTREFRCNGFFLGLVTSVQTGTELQFIYVNNRRSVSSAKKRDRRIERRRRLRIARVRTGRTSRLTHASQFRFCIVGCSIFNARHYFRFESFGVRLFTSLSFP